MSRLNLARQRLSGPEALPEFRARMGGYLDAAITLIDAAARDAVENLAKHPDDERTKQAVVALSTAMQALDPLVTLLCPLTTAQFRVVPAQEPAHE